MSLFDEIRAKRIAVRRVVRIVGWETNWLTILDSHYTFRNTCLRNWGAYGRRSLD